MLISSVSALALPIKKVIVVRAILDSNIYHISYQYIHIDRRLDEWQICSLYLVNEYKN